MIVAVAAVLPSSSVAPSLPPQQSPIFGHRASSQTVCKPSPRRSFLILEKDFPFGIDVFRYDGRRGLLLGQLFRRPRWSITLIRTRWCSLVPLALGYFP